MFNGSFMDIIGRNDHWPHETHSDCKACLYNHPGQVRGQPPPGGTIEDAEQQAPRLQRRVHFMPLWIDINRYAMT